jgi:ribulose kinase
MNTLAEKLPVGSEGLITIEHWQGNRTPFTDPNSRGVIRGLSLKHTPVHVYRSIMEAVAYGTEASLRIVKDNNMDIFELIAVGGHTNSPLWTQIYADVTGLPIRKTTNPEATSLGAAILAAVASGKYATVTEAADSMVKFGEEVKPDMARHEEYKFFVDQYIKTYEALKDSIRETNEYIKNQ